MFLRRVTCLRHYDVTECKCSEDMKYVIGKRINLFIVLVLVNMYYYTIFNHLFDSMGVLLRFASD